MKNGIREKDQSAALKVVASAHREEVAVDRPKKVEANDDRAKRKK